MKLIEYMKQMIREGKLPSRAAAAAHVANQEQQTKKALRIARLRRRNEVR